MSIKFSLIFGPLAYILFVDILGMSFLGGLGLWLMICGICGIINNLFHKK